MQKVIRFCSLFVALFLALSAEAAQVRGELPIIWKYDLDSADYVYCSLSPDIQVTSRIETSGSSATVTAVTGTGDAFANVAVGDEIVAESVLLSAPVTFTVVARASATSITADRAVDLDVANGAVFHYRSLRCGTGATAGWFTVPPGVSTITISYVQGDLTGGVTFSIQTRNRGSYGVPVQADTGTIAATTALANSTSVVLGETNTEWRVGLKYHTADPADNAANLEQIGVVLSYEYDR